MTRGVNIIADGRKRSGPPEDSSSSRARQRFGPPKYPDARRRNMTMKCIAAVLIVLGMIMTAGATPQAPRTRAPIYKPHRVSWAELREELYRRKGFRRTSAEKYQYLFYTLVPDTWYASTSYCCVRVWYFKALLFFAASYSYGNFLSAGLGSSPICGSTFSVCKAEPLLDTWYSSSSDA